MTKKNLDAQIEQLLNGLDTQADVAEATKLLHERFFEKSLNSELDNHLEYEKHQPKSGTNSRNGVISKTVRTEGVALWRSIHLETVKALSSHRSSRNARHGYQPLIQRLLSSTRKVQRRERLLKH